MKDGLCTTCRHSVIATGDGESQRVIRCLYFFDELRWTVRRCTGYADARLPSREAMEEIAWFIVKDKAGREIGFVSANDFKKLKAEQD